MAEAEFENEVTLSKTTKAEINGRLDEMLGDLTVYWNLWQEVDGHDDHSAWSPLFLASVTNRGEL